MHGLVARDPVAFPSDTTLHHATIRHILSPAIKIPVATKTNQPEESKKKKEALKYFRGLAGDWSDR